MEGGEKEGNYCLGSYTHGFVEPFFKYGFQFLAETHCKVIAVTRVLLAAGLFEPLWPDLH